MSSKLVLSECEKKQDISDYIEIVFLTLFLCVLVFGIFREVKDKNDCGVYSNQDARYRLCINDN